MTVLPFVKVLWPAGNAERGNLVGRYVRVFVAVTLVLLHVRSWASTPYTFTTLAGTPDVYGSADGTGAAVQFGRKVGNGTAFGVAVDKLGNVYVADCWNNTIRKITPGGTSTTIAGTAGQQGSTDGIGVQARFLHPMGLAIDGSGNLIVADTDNGTIRRIAPDGTVTTVAGLAGAGGKTDGHGSEARFSSPIGVGVDQLGNIFVADSGNNLVRKISPTADVTTLAGGAEYSGALDGTGAAASFAIPTALAVDLQGNIYVGDVASALVRKITPAGVVTTLCGGIADNFGSTDGTGWNARFYSPDGIAVDAAGNVYVADSTSDAIRMILPDGELTTISGISGHVATVDGTGDQVRFYYPEGIASDAGGTLYVMDMGGYAPVLRKGVPQDPLSPVLLQNPKSATVAIGGPVSFAVIAAGAPGTYACRWQHELAGTSVWSDLVEGGPFSGVQTGRLTVTPADLSANGDQFRCIVSNGVGPDVITETAQLTVVAAGTSVFPGTIYTFWRATNGAVNGYPLSFGLAVCTDSAGNVYFSDLGRCIIQKMMPDQTVTTLAGNLNTPGTADGTGTAAEFASPVGLVADANGNIFVADQQSCTIRKVTPAGVVTTFAGSAGNPGIADGQGANARFAQPSGITIDPAGNLFVADVRSDRTVIRKIGPDGNVSTYAGANQVVDPTNPSTAGRLIVVFGITADRSGNLFAVDWFDCRVKKIAPDGTISTIAGTGQSGDRDGQALDAEFAQPSAITSDAAGYLYVTDLAESEIRKVSPSGAVTTVVDSVTNQKYPFPDALYGIAVDSAGNLFIVENHQLASDPAEWVFHAMPDSFLPWMDAQPSGHEVALGASVTFSAHPMGTPTPALQWWKDGMAIPGATSATYTIDKVVSGDAGQYFITATNEVGSMASVNAALVVDLPPVISLQPASQQANPGEQITFTAAATGIPGPMFQWQKDGIDIAGATAASLTLTNLQTIDGGTYRVIATNIGGSVASNDATLSVFGVPALKRQPANGSAPAGANAIFTVLAAGTPSPTYQWQMSSDGSTGWIDLSDSANYAGTATDSLRILGATPELAAVQYRCVVSNSFGSVVSAVVTLSLVARPGDFDGNGSTDLLWDNTATGDRAIWYLNGTAIGTFGYLAGIAPDWHIVGTADFNGDGHPDLIWENITTGDRSFWLMNGTTINSFAYLAYVDPSWHIAAAGDLDSDGQPDLIWENTATGDRAVWFLQGPSLSSFGYIANIPSAWHIVGAADFDGDGYLDLVWENLVTGDRTVWYMNGTHLKGFGYIANIPGAWHIAKVADFDGDGHPDLLWENTTTGDRAFWLMNDVNLLSAPYFAFVDPLWRIVP